MSFVSSLVITGAAITCSVLQPSRNCEYGLFKECLWFLEASNGVLEGLLGRGGWESIFTYHGEMLDSPAIFLQVLSTGVAKKLSCVGTFVRTEGRILNIFPEVVVGLHWTWPIRKVSSLERESAAKSGTKGWHQTHQGSPCHSFES